MINSRELARLTGRVHSEILQFAKTGLTRFGLNPRDYMVLQNNGRTQTYNIPRILLAKLAVIYILEMPSAAEIVALQTALADAQAQIEELTNG